MCRSLIRTAFVFFTTKRSYTNALRLQPKARGETRCRNGMRHFSYRNHGARFAQRLHLFTVHHILKRIVNRNYLILLLLIYMTPRLTPSLKRKDSRLQLACKSNKENTLPACQQQNERFFAMQAKTEDRRFRRFWREIKDLARDYGEVLLAAVCNYLKKLDLWIVGRPIRPPAALRQCLGSWVPFVTCDKDLWS